MSLLAAGGQLLPAATAIQQACERTASPGPGSIRLQQAAQQRIQRRGRVRACSQAQLVEPEIRWQTLEALYSQADSTPAWSSSMDRDAQASSSREAPTCLLVQLNEPPQSLQEKEERRKLQDYYANVGDAIRTLREEIPRLFMADLTYEIYREDVVFKDPRNTVKGKTAYRRLFNAIRIIGRICFSPIYIRIQRIWQPDERTIRVRWKLHGVPRIPWEVEGIFEGISNFKLDKEGKIYEHSVDNVILRDPPLGISPLWTNLQRVLSPQPQPCPGLSRCETQDSPAKQAREVACISKESPLQLPAMLGLMHLMHPLNMEPGQG